jgi:hypothetical protein
MTGESKDKGLGGGICSWLACIYGCGDVYEIAVESSFTLFFLPSSMFFFFEISSSLLKSSII